MEKLKKKARPYSFKSLKVVKSTIEFIRFEADCNSKSDLNSILTKLDRITLKISGFVQPLKVKSAKVKNGNLYQFECQLIYIYIHILLLGATRHEWESYFRDNPTMNEMKPGLRPDTLHIENLPVKWFGGEKPSSNLVVKVFSVFGHIRRFHIPSLDNHNNNKDDGFKRFSFNETLSFDAYIQYCDYIGFVKAMDALRGMKLVKQLSEFKNQKERFLEYDIKVDFDKTKHLSDKEIKKRKIMRESEIKSTLDLQKIKNEASEERKKQENKIKTDNKNKQQAKSLLTYLFSMIENEEHHKWKVEENKETEQNLKKKLLDEEAKLREKLLERRREQIRQETKGKLKSVAQTSATASQSVKTINSDTKSNSLNNNSLLHQNSKISSSDINHQQNHHHNNYVYNHSPLYKKHKKGCKYYKRKSLIGRKDENK